MGQTAHALVLYYFILCYGFKTVMRCALLFYSAVVTFRRKNRRKRWRGVWHVGNPAFGGRGAGIWRRHCKTNARLAFDSTLGFPGEGWSSKFPNLHMATWNTRSLTCERFEYCKSLKYDILALTELWRNQAKYQNRSKQFIVSEPKIIKKGPRKGQPRFPDDRAAGVAIMFSAAAQKKVLAFGSEGERICWVRLRGPSYLLSVRDRNLPTT